MSRYKVLDSYAKDKENRLEVLKMAASKKLTANQLDEKMIRYLLNEAYQLGHYVGHIRGEQYQSGLLESYKQALYEA